MATAKVRTETTQTVSLQLTMDEAQALAEILGSVGGDPTPGTGRSLCDNISTALKGEGLQFTKLNGSPGRPVRGNIIWKDSE